MATDYSDEAAALLVERQSTEAVRRTLSQRLHGAVNTILPDLAASVVLALLDAASPPDAPTPCRRVT